MYENKSVGRSAPTTRNTWRDNSFGSDRSVKTFGPIGSTVRLFGKFLTTGQLNGHEMAKSLIETNRSVTSLNPVGRLRTVDPIGWSLWPSGRYLCPGMVAFVCLPK